MGRVTGPRVGGGGAGAGSAGRCWLRVVDVARSHPGGDVSARRSCMELADSVVAVRRPHRACGRVAGLIGRRVCEEVQPSRARGDTTEETPRSLPPTIFRGYGLVVLRRAHASRPPPWRCADRYGQLAGHIGLITRWTAANDLPPVARLAAAPLSMGVRRRGYDYAHVDGGVSRSPQSHRPGAAAGVHWRPADHHRQR